jgi:hypothetical protein
LSGEIFGSRTVAGNRPSAPSRIQPAPPSTLAPNRSARGDRRQPRIRPREDDDRAGGRDHQHDRDSHAHPTPRLDHVSREPETESIRRQAAGPDRAVSTRTSATSPPVRPPRNG